MKKVSLIVLLLILFLALNPVMVFAEEGSIRIMAAASLMEVFNDLKAGFEEKYQGIELEINYAGSQALFSQINMGVRADIFASANIKYMNQLQGLNMVVNPNIFAHNKLVIAVFKKTEIDIHSFEDLLQNDIRLVIADESVPVGRYTVQILKKQSEKPGLSADFQEKFIANVISKELDVKSVVAKVELGEADAGIVYKTDVNSSNKDNIKTVNIEDKYNVIADYSIALLKGISSKNGEIAIKFLDYLYSLEGGRVLEEHGFVKESRG